MRVQAGDHARDRVGDEFFLVNRLHIVGFDHAKHGGQLLQLFQRQGREPAPRNRLQLHGRQRTGDRADGNPACYLEFLTHKHLHLPDFGAVVTEFETIYTLEKGPCQQFPQSTPLGCQHAGMF